MTTTTHPPLTKTPENQGHAEATKQARQRLSSLHRCCVLLDSLTDGLAVGGWVAAAAAAWLAHGRERGVMHAYTIPRALIIIMTI